MGCDLSDLFGMPRRTTDYGRSQLTTPDAVLDQGFGELEKMDARGSLAALLSSYR